MTDAIDKKHANNLARIAALFDDKVKMSDRIDQLERELAIFRMAQVVMDNTVEALTEERHRLALAICGGEDAPGYANAQTVETLEHVAKQNQQAHWATINSLLAEEAERDEALNQLDSARYSVEVLEKRVAEFMAERDRLREALNQSRLAFAGYVSVQSAIDLIDRAALKGASHE